MMSHLPFNSSVITRGGALCLLQFLPKLLYLLAIIIVTYLISCRYRYPITRGGAPLCFSLYCNYYISNNY